VVKVLPVTSLCMILAALAAVGLPPFGLFLSELTIISGGLAARQTTVSVLILAALLASFCGILQQLTRILPGERKPGPAVQARRTDGLPAMVLLLGGLLLFSFWMPAPLRKIMHQAAGIIGGVR
jgi:hydrogenase-4 component F